MPIEDIFEESKRILSVAKERGITLRLLDGMAIRFRCKSALTGSLARKYADIDLIGHSKQSKQIQALFTDLSYSPRNRFNAMHGDTRLIFNDAGNQWRVDIFPRCL